MAFYQTVPMISIGFLYLCCQIFFLAWKKRFDVKRVWHATRFVRRNQLCHTQTHLIWWRMAFFVCLPFSPIIPLEASAQLTFSSTITNNQCSGWQVLEIDFDFSAPFTSLLFFFLLFLQKKNSISFGSFSFGFRLNCFQQDLKDFNSINMHLT